MWWSSRRTPGSWRGRGSPSRCSSQPVRRGNQTSTCPSPLSPALGLLLIEGKVRSTELWGLRLSAIFCEVVPTDVSEERVTSIFRALARVIPSTLKLEVTRSSETLVYNKPTQCHIPEDSILQELSSYWIPRTHIQQKYHSACTKHLFNASPNLEYEGHWHLGIWHHVVWETTTKILKEMLPPC
jgi:hypothetical protein